MAQPQGSTRGLPQQHVAGVGCLFVAAVAAEHCSRFRVSGLGFRV